MANWRQCLMAVLVIYSVQLCIATQYEDCGSSDEVYSFVLTDCDIPPCIILRPGSYDVNITFKAASSCETLDTKITARIGDDDFPWPGPNGCKQLVNDSCPIHEGVTYFYSATMPVYSSYPAITTVVTWKLTDEFEINHVCTKIPITLV